VWGDREVVGNISSTGDVPLVKFLPHPPAYIIDRSIDHPISAWRRDRDGRRGRRKQKRGHAEHELR